MTDKKVKLNLVGLDGKAFSLLGAFQAQARKEGWAEEEIAEVREEAMSGDYNHVLVTLMDHIDSPDYDEDDEDEYDNDDFEDDWDDNDYEDEEN